MTTIELTKALSDAFSTTATKPEKKQALKYLKNYRATIIKKSNNRQACPQNVLDAINHLKEDLGDLTGKLYSLFLVVLGVVFGWFLNNFVTINPNTPEEGVNKSHQESSQ